MTTTATLEISFTTNNDKEFFIMKNFRIVDNTGFSRTPERENGHIIVFEEKSDFESYNFNDQQIVEAVFIDDDGGILSRVWFNAEMIEK
jgi:hypothetical protein